MENLQHNQVTAKTEFGVAEYNALRQEMLQHMQSEIQITSFALIFTSSVLGLFATSSRTLLLETLLLPLPVLWFGIYAVLEHHQQVVTIGTYLFHFFESQDSGLAWEHRLTLFRQRTKNFLWKPFRFHGFVWFLYTVLAALCVVPATIQSNPISIWIVLAGIVALLIAIHTFSLTMTLEKVQPKFDDTWQHIYADEQSQLLNKASEITDKD